MRATLLAALAHVAAWGFAIAFGVCVDLRTEPRRPRRWPAGEVFDGLRG